MLYISLITQIPEMVELKIGAHLEFPTHTLKLSAPWMGKTGWLTTLVWEAVLEVPILCLSVYSQAPGNLALAGVTLYWMTRTTQGPGN